MELSLALQLENIDIDSWELTFRSILFKEVVGKDWVTKKVIEELSYDASLLGISLYKLLGRWLRGTYENIELGKLIKLRDGIDWLLSGNRELLHHLDKHTIVDAYKKTSDICRNYLEASNDKEEDEEEEEEEDEGGNHIED